MWFREYPDAVIVHGKVRSTLYFLGDKKVIHLTKTESDIMKALENNEVEDVGKEFGEVITKRAIKELLNYGIGNLYKTKVLAEKYKPYTTFEIPDYFQERLVIHNFYIQVDEDDPYDYYEAIHNEKVIVEEGCNSCLITAKLHESIAKYYCHIYDNLNKIKEIQINRVKLFGGNILKQWNRVKGLIEYLETVYGTNIDMVLPVVQLTEEIIKYFSEHNINIVISILAHYVNDTTFKKHFEDMNHELEKNNVDYSCNIIIDSSYPIDMEKIRLYLSEFKPLATNYTHIIHNNREGLVALPVGTDRIENIDMDMYHARKKFNYCRMGVIAINMDGSIRPCIFSINKIGHLSEGLIQVFEKNLHTKYWRFTKDNVNPCKQCENRYACVDCSILEEKCNLSESNIKIFCEYDFNKGVWINGEIEREDFAWKL
jgi:radical SAM protein with 4Fe4S-binding SPASM domain